MNSRHPPLFRISLLLAIAPFCSVFGITIASPTQTVFDIPTLLIDQSPFPPGWTMDQGGPHAVNQGDSLFGGGIGALETAEVGFYFLVEGGSAHADEQVYRLDTPQDAKREFDLHRVQWFSVGPYDTEWSQPTDSPYESDSAQDFYYACSNQGSIPMCQMLALYGEYLVRFHAQMAAYDSTLTLIPALSVSQFEAIVATVDERIGTTLQTLTH